MKREEIIRNEILLQCFGYRPNARDTERMARAARKEGELVDAMPAEFAREAAYLVGKGLIVQSADGISKDHKRYAITSAGIDYVEEQGLA